MITVQNSTKQNKGVGNIFNINGKEIVLGISRSKILYVENMTIEIWNAINNRDIECYRKVITKYQLTQVLKVSLVFESEFANFIRFICNQLRLENRCISVANVFLEIGIPSASVRKSLFEFVYSTVHEVVEEYLKIILESIECKNKDFVWSYASALRKSLTAVDLVGACVSLGKPFEDYLHECVKHIEDDTSGLGWMHLFNYSLYGERNAKFIRSNHLYKFFEVHGNVFKEVRRESYLSKLEAIKAKKYKFSEDVWAIYDRQLEHIHRHELDFSDFKGELKHQVKLYIQDALRSTKSTRIVVTRLYNIKKCYQVLRVYPFQSFLELNTVLSVTLIDGEIGTDNDGGFLLSSPTE